MKEETTTGGLGDPSNTKSHGVIFQLAVSEASHKEPIDKDSEEYPFRESNCHKISQYVESDSWKTFNNLYHQITMYSNSFNIISQYKKFLLPLVEDAIKAVNYRQDRLDKLKLFDEESDTRADSFTATATFELNALKDQLQSFPKSMSPLGSWSTANQSISTKICDEFNKHLLTFKNSSNRLQSIIYDTWNAGDFIKLGSDAGFADLRQMETRLISTQVKLKKLENPIHIIEQFPLLMNEFNHLNAAMKFWRSSRPRMDTFQPAPVAVLFGRNILGQTLVPDDSVMTWCKKRQIQTLYVENFGSTHDPLDPIHRQLYLGLTQIQESKSGFASQIPTWVKHKIEPVSDTLDAALDASVKMDPVRIIEALQAQLTTG